MIPIKYDDDGNVEEVAHAYNPFMRGVMEFDDYNYTVHNPYVLVEDPKYADNEAEAGARAGSPKSNVSKAPQVPTIKKSDNLDVAKFSEKNLN